jgi:DNA primase
MPKEKKPFVDFRAIRVQITMEQVLEHYGVLGTLKRSGSRLSGPCPIHNGTNPTQFRVDTEKNLWNCFSECKGGGNVLDFIARKENLPVHDAALIACEWFGIPATDARADSAVVGKPPSSPPKGAAKDDKPAAPVQAKENSINPSLKFRLENLNRSHPYFQERGITQETVIDFGLGYFNGTKGLMTGRVVIPIHDLWGQVVAYAGRWPGEPPKDTPKYKLPPNFKKSLELYNVDRAIKEPADKPLVIVEGFFDAIKLHQLGCRKVVALMGSSMSSAQEELIRQHITPTSRVLVILDEDEAGRAGRVDIATRLSPLCFTKIHVFARFGMQPEHLSPEQVTQITGGVQ